MKTLHTILFALLATFSLTAAARAANADPSGHWQWLIPGPNGTTDATAVFACKDGVLTGTLTVMGSDEAISQGTCKDGAVAFTVDRPIGDGERKTYEWKTARAR